MSGLLTIDFCIIKFEKGDKIMMLQARNVSMVLQNANVLVLDEPTRNFSPLSAPVIRTALSEFNGTIISISHDRMYLDEVADVIYELSDNGLNTVL